jgi:hypothetical protein
MPQALLDTGEVIAFQKQLEQVAKTVKERKLKRLPFADGSLLPINTEIENWAETFAIIFFDQVGIANFITHWGKDFPRVSIATEKKIFGIEAIGDSYGWNIDEIRKSIKLGIPLQTRLTIAARRAIMKKIDDIAFFGDTPRNLPGFFTNPNISTLLLPADGTGAKVNWSTKTPDQIIRDVRLMTTEIRLLTNEIETPNTLLLDTASFELINGTRLGDGSDVTIARFIIDNNVHISDIQSVTNLTDPENTGEPFAMLYDRNPEQVELFLPSPIETFAPQQTNLEWNVNLLAKVGGTIIHRPLSVLKAELTT